MIVISLGMPGEKLDLGELNHKGSAVIEQRSSTRNDECFLRYAMLESIY